ncbi:MAG: hypothetical protein K9M03_04050 [Kiritimatiellales bacterium]|nr:hypothetical protein [Kiritimatiellales bacterium]
MQCPKLLRPLYRAWCTFSTILGRVMSFIILTILWLTLFGIYAIIIKTISAIKKFPSLFGGGARGGYNTYWVDPLSEVPNGMQDQF